MKRYFAVVIALILLMSLAVPAGAVTQEAELTYLDTKQDVVFWVTWDVKIPYIVFLSPDGKRYDPMNEYNNNTTILGDTSLYFIIKDAPAGQWKLLYDKGQNTVLEVSVHNYASPIYIESFTTGEVEGNRIPVTFQVSGEQGAYFSYKISAMTGHTGVEKELYSGYASVGLEESVDVDLSQLASYSNYMLKLYVWYDDNGADIFDFVFSEPFAYTNAEMDAQAPEVALTVDPLNTTVYVTCPNLSWNVDSIMVALFQNGGDEPVMFREYEPGEVQDLQLVYDPASAEVAVEVSVKIDGVYSAPSRKSFQPADIKVSIQEGKTHNSLVLPMTYADMSQQLVSVTVNDYRTDLVLDGSGNVNITLGDDWNDLKIAYSDTDNITWMLTTQIYVDRLAPVLNMSQSYDGMQTESSSIIISGSVMDHSSLTINGQLVSVDSSGLFSHEVTLSTGANTVEVIASDKLGNEARYTAVIYCGVELDEWIEEEANKDAPGGLLEILTGTGSYWVLLIVSVLCLMVIGYALIFWRKEAKK